VDEQTGRQHDARGHRGAGFAGLATVSGLSKAGAEVTIIDKKLYSTFQPLLYQVATGG